MTILIPKYVPSALTKLQHSPSLKPQHSPVLYIILTYGVKLQYGPIEEEHLYQLSDEKKKYIQWVVGTFLYYTYALDSTILVALSVLGSEQASGSKKMLDNIIQLLNYLATHRKASIQYY